MESDKRFEELYQLLLTKEDNKLKELRKKAKTQKIKEIILISITIIIFICIDFPLFGNFMSIHSDDGYSLSKMVILLCILPASFIFTMILIIILSNKIIGKEDLNEKYQNDFKEKIITTMVSFFDKDLIYEKNNGIDFSDYIDAEFEKYDRYLSEDLIYGKILNDRTFKMAEILTSKKNRDRDGQDYYTTIFYGIFVKAETPKPLNASIYLRKQNSNATIHDDLKIQMDSSEFEKIWDIYSDNKILTMQILTADIMEILVDFKNKTNIDYEVTIKNNNIYIRFASNNVFEGDYKNSLDKKSIYEYYKIIDFTLGILKNLAKAIVEADY